MNDVHNMDIEENFKHKSLMTAEAKSLFADVKMLEEHDEIDEEFKRYGINQKEYDNYTLRKLRFSRRIQYYDKGLPAEMAANFRYPAFPLSEYYRLHQRTVLGDLAGLEVSIWILIACATGLLRVLLLLPVFDRLLGFLGFGVVFVMSWAYYEMRSLASIVSKLTPAKVEVDPGWNARRNAELEDAVEEISKESVEVAADDMPLMMRSGMMMHQRSPAGVETAPSGHNSSQLMLPDPVAWPSDPRFQLKQGPKTALVDLLIEYAFPSATFGSTAASQLKLCHDCQSSHNLSDAVKADQTRDLCE
jgi:hypothetical protein